MWAAVAPGSRLCIHWGKGNVRYTYNKKGTCPGSIGNVLNLKRYFPYIVYVCYTDWVKILRRFVYGVFTEVISQVMEFES